MLQFLGVTLALSVTPVFTLLGFIALFACTTLNVLSAVIVLRRLLNYAVNKPVRELLFTKTSRKAT